MAALAAVVGLAFVGHMFSKDDGIEKTEIDTIRNNANVEYPLNEIETMKKTNLHSQMYLENFKKEAQPRKREVEYLGEITDFGTRNVFGQPVYNMSQRENVSNKMNNLNPNPWIRVGPGIGVGPNVPAFGGKQQLFRILPVNMNEHRLTNLPGRPTGAPKSLISAGEAPQNVSKNRPDRLLIRDPTKSSAIKTAPELRPTLIKTQQVTRKDQTILAQGENLLTGPKYNRGMGYMTNPQSKLDTCDRRSKPDRFGNAGRMNVRADPLNSFGMVTSVRIDSNSTHVPPPKAIVPENYARTFIQEVNPYKDSINPNIDSLNVAKEVLKTNPYNHSVA